MLRYEHLLVLARVKLLPLYDPGFTDRGECPALLLEDDDLYSAWQLLLYANREEAGEY